MREVIPSLGPQPVAAGLELAEQLVLALGIGSADGKRLVDERQPRLRAADLALALELDRRADDRQTPVVDHGAVNDLTKRAFALRFCAYP